jgi:hypothetical protein
MLRIPHCPDNRLTDGGKVVILETNIYFLQASFWCVPENLRKQVNRPDGQGAHPHLSKAEICTGPLFTRYFLYGFMYRSDRTHAGSGGKHQPFKDETSSE